jgi:pimeloyl-ACP methyl ester carboxylesterase
MDAAARSTGPTQPHGTPRAHANGELVGEYRLERCLGRGSMGEVWYARHVLSGGESAVKFAQTPDEHFQALFARERRAVARLAHPHVVRLFDVGPDYMVLAYVDGVDLERKLRSPLPPAEAIAICAQVASALAHAHARGVVHSDVKPANILVDQRGVAYLADFGVARFVDDATDKLVGGTRAYGAPEQFTGTLPTPASDQYALARTLARALIAEALPKRDDALWTLLERTLPPALLAVLRRALATSPEARFPSIDAFADAVREAAQGEFAVVSHVLAPVRGATPFAWAAHGKLAGEPAWQIQRAEFGLDAIVAADPAARDRVEAFRATTGYSDFSWSLFAHADRLGAVTSPEALARARAIVVLSHGMLCTRRVWDFIAPAICRDNGGVAVLAPDVNGFGGSPIPEPRPDEVAPEGLARALLAWLALLGIDGHHMPVVLVGHSMSGLALLSLDDRTLGAGTLRLCVTPYVPPKSKAVRALHAVSAFFVYLFCLVPPLFRRIARAALSSAQRSADLADGELSAVVAQVEAVAPRVVAYFMKRANATRIVPPSAPERCGLVFTANDQFLPYPPAQTLDIVTALGFTQREQIRFLPNGGHFPHMKSARHPEWTARNHADILRLIDDLLGRVEERRLVTPSALESTTRPLTPSEMPG